MAMTVGPSEAGDDELVASINTTPLVDVMLVLLIIFLITIPVVIHTVPLDLPKERNQPRQTKPENISISVNREGDVFWDSTRLSKRRGMPFGCTSASIPNRSNSARINRLTVMIRLVNMSRGQSTRSSP